MSLQTFLLISFLVVHSNLIHPMDQNKILRHALKNNEYFDGYSDELIEDFIKDPIETQAAIDSAEHDMLHDIPENFLEIDILQERSNNTIVETIINNAPVLMLKLPNRKRKLDRPKNVITIRKK